MRTGHLFLHTWEDLERRAQERTSPFELLAVSRLVRQLLLDENPLAHQVNRQHRLKLVFRVLPNDLNQPDVADDLRPDFELEPALSPARWPMMESRAQEVKLEGFLQHPVLRVRTDVFSVHDVVDYVAHVLGGVHSRQERSDRERLLGVLGEQFSDLVGSHPVLLFMRDLAAVVAEGLHPLYLAEQALR